MQTGMFTLGFEEAFAGVMMVDSVLVEVDGSADILLRIDWSIEPTGKLLPEDTRRLLAALGALQGDEMTLCLISAPGQRPFRLRATLEMYGGWGNWFTRNRPAPPIRRRMQHTRRSGMPNPWRAGRQGRQEHAKRQRIGAV